MQDLHSDLVSAGAQPSHRDEDAAPPKDAQDAGADRCCWGAGQLRNRPIPRACFPLHDLHAAGDAHARAALRRKKRVRRPQGAVRCDRVFENGFLKSTRGDTRRRLGDKPPYLAAGLGTARPTSAGHARARREVGRLVLQAPSSLATRRFPENHLTGVKR